MDELKCTACGSTLDEKGYCSICLRYCSIPKEETAAEGATEVIDEMLADADALHTMCPECGMTGVPGSACRQCGTVLPAAAFSDVQSYAPEPASVCVPDLVAAHQSCSPNAAQYCSSPQYTVREERPSTLTLPDSTCKMLNPGVTYLIGRESNDADIVSGFANTPTISRRHCELSVVAGGARELLIRDLGSTNGTYANGMKLMAHQQMRVPIPATIGLGETVRIEIR